MNRTSQILLLIIAAALLWYGPAWTGMVGHQSEERSPAVLPVAQKHFQQVVIDSPRTTLVEFGADWCSACRSLRPSVDQIASENRDRLQVVAVDLDQNQELAARYQIRSIPTLILFRDGKAVDRLVGAVPRDSLEQWLEGRIASPEKLVLEKAH